MSNDLPRLLDRIRELMDEPADDSSEPLLGRIEHTLTDGYARALSLEADVLRIERKIAAILASVERDADVAELAALSDRLAETKSELARLRSLLDALRRRADVVRVAAPERVTRSRFERRTPPPEYGCRSAAS